MLIGGRGIAASRVRNVAARAVRSVSFGWGILGGLIVACLTDCSVFAKDSSPQLPGIEPRQNSIGMEFVRAPAGVFEMGASPNDEDADPKIETRHEVTITFDYLIGAHEVTRGQFKQFVEATGYRTDAEKEGFSFKDHAGTAEAAGVNWKQPGFPQTDDHPVVCVSWLDAVNFCDWLSRKEQRRCRLPSEAEWEYAARAGETARFPWGDQPDDGAGWANVADQSLHAKANGLSQWFAFTDGYVCTAPVGSFRPNRWGLYDTCGNVCEWCIDRAGTYIETPQTNPVIVGPNSEHIVRGGAWDLGPSNTRVSNRAYAYPYHRFPFVGFRVVQEINPPTEPERPTAARDEDKASDADPS